MGFAIEFTYPSQVSELNRRGGTQEQNAPRTLITKNGVQLKRNVPMMTPSVIAALWSDVLYCVTVARDVDAPFRDLVWPVNVL